jgi:hypothetical protein
VCNKKDGSLKCECEKGLMGEKKRMKCKEKCEDVKCGNNQL